MNETTEYDEPGDDLNSRDFYAVSCSNCGGTYEQYGFQPVICGACGSEDILVVPA